VTLLAWSKEQPWWPHVRGLIESGLYVLLHLPELPPVEERKLFHRPSGGCVEIAQCRADCWHIVLAADPHEMARVVRENSVVSPLGRPRGWMHTTVIDE